MLIFLVVAHYANGYRDERAFASHRAARAYAAAQWQDAQTEILEVPVIGELDRVDAAYTIEWSDRTPDTENVEVVYGNERHARSAVSGHGRVQRLDIDTSADASAAILALPERIGRDLGNLRHALIAMRRHRNQRTRTGYSQR